MPRWRDSEKGYKEHQMVRVPAASMHCTCDFAQPNIFKFMPVESKNGEIKKKADIARVFFCVMEG